MEGPGKPEREYSVTEILDRSFNLYSKHFVNLYLPFLAAAIVSGLLGALISFMVWVPTIWDPFGYAWDVMDPARLWGYIGAFIGAAVLTGIITWVVSTLATGAVTRYASEAIEKGRADLSDSVSYTASRLITLLVAGIITGILVAIGLILFIVPGIILFLMFSVVVPTIVIERQGVFMSLGRSRQLMGRRWLKAFALFILLGIIILIVGAVAGAISIFFGPLSAIVSGIITALVQPIYAVALVYLYYSMLAKEGEARPPEGPVGAPI